MTGSNYLNTLLILTYLAAAAIFVLLFYYREREIQLLEQRSRHIGLISSSSSDIIHVSYIKRVEPDHQCPCRYGQAIYLIKYWVNERPDEFFYESSLIFNENIVIKSHKWSSREFENKNTSCGLFNALKRGPSQRTFQSLTFDDKSKACRERLVAYVSRRMLQTSPESVLQVYYDANQVSLDSICHFECLETPSDAYMDNVDFCHMGGLH